MVKTLFTPFEVATLLGVSPVTVRQWAHKGMIDARTTAGGHRRFTREAVVAFASRMAMALPVEFATETARTRILIVDDDREHNALLVALITAHMPDAEVASALDAFAAGRQVQLLKPALVLLDIALPGVDGVDVCRQIRADGETCARVIAMTKLSTPALEQTVLAAGAAALLRKPFSTQDLLAALKSTGVESRG
jgi:excisionase family DNA binding protein